MDKHLIAISTLSKTDLYWLLDYAIAFTNERNDLYDFSIEGLMKIKAVHKKLEFELWPNPMTEGENANN